MPFVKLDCGILNSTLWIDREARELFLTALLMAVPYELTEPMAQLDVHSADLTGWSVPPGWYGFVPAAGRGIIVRAGFPPASKSAMAALERLGAPEPDSRSPDHEGRRLVRVDGGYVVLNFVKYRDRDYSNATRQRRWRERNKGKAKSKDNGVTSRDNGVTVTQAEAEAEGHKRTLRSSSSGDLSPSSSGRGESRAIKNRDEKKRAVDAAVRGIAQSKAFGGK